MTISHENLIVVGGSLAGLTFALACANRGLEVQVLERSPGHVVGGDSLTVDLSLLAATVGHDPKVEPVLPVVPAYRDLTTWTALYSWLRDRTLESPRINLQEGQRVVDVQVLGEQALLTLDDGAQKTASVVIGADGYRSVVRKAINPDAPLAVYSGYLVWRGLIDERSLTAPVAWPSNGGLWIDYVDGYRLVAAVLPGRDGSIEIGRRQVTFAWFDVHQETLLRDTRCLTPDGHIAGTLSRGKIDSAVLSVLAERASRIWPAPWREAVLAGVSSPETLSGAPIAEYMPLRLATGPLAILGDAAHVISPMTGRGFLTAVEDAALLVRLLSEKAPSKAYSAVLAQYESARSDFIRGLVAHSIRASSNYLRYAKVGSNPSGFPSERSA